MDIIRAVVFYLKRCRSIGVGFFINMSRKDEYLMPVNEQERRGDGVYSLTYEYLLKKYGLTITFKEAAAELGVYWENIRKLCKRGDIAAQKVGKSWLLTTKALADYIDHGPANKTLTLVLPSIKDKGRGKRQKYVSL
jgi:excisionase family DNA binding protein